MVVISETHATAALNNFQERHIQEALDREHLKSASYSTEAILRDWDEEKRRLQEQQQLQKAAT